MSKLKDRELTKKEKEVIGQAVHIVSFLPLEKYDRKKFSNSPEIFEEFTTTIKSPKSKLSDLLDFYTTAQPILKAYNKYLDFQIKDTLDEQEKEEYYSDRRIVNLLWRWLDDTMYEIGQVTL